MSKKAPLSPELEKAYDIRLKLRNERKAKRHAKNQGKFMGPVSKIDGKPLVGRENWFKPGHKIGCEGRPKKLPITRLYEEMLEEAKFPTEIKVAVRKMVRRANKTAVMMIKEMAERVEGKVAQKVELSGTIGLADRVAAARKRVTKKDEEE